MNSTRTGAVAGAVGAFRSIPAPLIQTLDDRNGLPVGELVEHPSEYRLRLG